MGNTGDKGRGATSGGSEDEEVKGSCVASELREQYLTRGSKENGVGGEGGRENEKRKGRGTREREGVGGGIKEGRKKGKRLEAYQMSGDACPTYMNVGTLITDPEDRVNKVWMLTKQNK